MHRVPSTTRKIVRVFIMLRLDRWGAESDCDCWSGWDERRWEAWYKSGGEVELCKQKVVRYVFLFASNDDHAASVIGTLTSAMQVRSMIPRGDWVARSTHPEKSLFSFAPQSRDVDCIHDSQVSYSEALDCSSWSGRCNAPCISLLQYFEWFAAIVVTWTNAEQKYCCAIFSSFPVMALADNATRSLSPCMFTALSSFQLQQFLFQLILLMWVAIDWCNAHFAFVAQYKAGTVLHGRFYITSIDYSSYFTPTWAIVVYIWTEEVYSVVLILTSIWSHNSYFQIWRTHLVVSY